MLVVCKYIDKSDCHLAFDLAISIDDVEDCLDLFTAKRNKAAIITADQAMVERYQKNFDRLILV